MKIGFLVTAYLFLICAQVEAQKNDYVWLQGYDSYGGYEPSAGLYFGNPRMDFNDAPVKITRDSLAMDFIWTNTSYSDSAGNLLFFTNGAYIANLAGDSIENSDSLNWGFWMAYDDPDHGRGGYLLREGVYALQSLTNSNQYYIIHCLIDSNAQTGGAILCTLLDMSLNQGKGKVIYKNKPLLIDKIGLEFRVNRHANGRYWWIITHKINTNCYYRMLLDESGPHLINDSVCAGATYTPEDYGPMNFSQDGNKLLTLGYNTGLNIFDFDRCNGNISNSLNIPYPFLADSGWGCAGLATSPNSRYLYVSLTVLLLQYDLWAADIPGSVDTIGVYDGFIGSLATPFCTQQNGPDGKIYMSCGNADTVYHVINNPDAKGDSCNFVQHGVKIPSPSWGVPSYPNYRLGALPKNACDSLTGLNDEARASKEQIIKVYPNPANDYTIVDYGFTDWNKAQPNLELCNALGQVVYTQPLPMYSGVQKIDVSRFATGMYTVFIKRNGAVVAVQKLVKAGL